MMKELDAFFQLRVEIPAMRHGNSKAIETLISEEAQILAKFIRADKKGWIPRIV